MRRRKVGNLLALAVLALLAERPMHPYEMASTLRQRGKDEDMAIKWGSLYTVVGNLEKHGFIEATGSTRQGRRPERTVYGITDDGREELEDWLRELVSVPEPEHPKFAAALSVLAVLPPDEAMDLLRQRVRAMEIDVAAQQAALAESGREVPRLFLVECEYRVTLRKAEAAWIRTLLEELTDGSLPGVAVWRALHETGRLPQEWAEFTVQPTGFAGRGDTTD